MEKELDSKELEQLYKAILKLKTVGECKKFFRDLCTFTELKAMAERFEVVQLIEENTPYREIAKRTGSSTATITRVAHWLHHGMGGYKLILNRMKKK